MMAKSHYISIKGNPWGNKNKKVIDKGAEWFDNWNKRGSSKAWISKEDHEEKDRLLPGEHFINIGEGNIQKLYIHCHQSWTNAEKGSSIADNGHPLRQMLLLKKTFKELLGEHFDKEKKVHKALSEVRFSEFDFGFKKRHNLEDKKFAADDFSTYAKNYLGWLDKFEILPTEFINNLAVYGTKGENDNGRYDLREGSRNPVVQFAMLGADSGILF